MPFKFSFFTSLASFLPSQLQRHLLSDERLVQARPPLPRRPHLWLAHALRLHPHPHLQQPHHHGVKQVCRHYITFTQHSYFHSRSVNVFNPFSQSGNLQLFSPSGRACNPQQTQFCWAWQLAIWPPSSFLRHGITTEHICYHHHGIRPYVLISASTM